MTPQASARLAGLLRRQHHHVAAATLVGESARLKTALLDAGIASGIVLSDLEEALRRCSALRRAVEQFEAARAVDSR